MNFNEKCYKVLKKVLKGRVITYKDIAKKLNTKAYRAVGRAMKANKNRKIKCYKVVCSNGKIGGFNRGIKEKIRLLRREGIEVVDGRVDKNYFFML